MLQLYEGTKHNKTASTLTFQGYWLPSLYLGVLGSNMWRYGSLTFQHFWKSCIPWSRANVQALKLVALSKDNTKRNSQRLLLGSKAFCCLRCCHVFWFVIHCQRLVQLGDVLTFCIIVFRYSTASTNRDYTQSWQPTVHSKQKRQDWLDVDFCSFGKFQPWLTWL